MMNELLLIEDISELVAETDKDAVDFYRRCGFVVFGSNMLYNNIYNYWFGEYNNLLTKLRRTASRERT